MASKNILWRDRKRPFLGLPLSFTVYTLTDEQLIIKKGLLRQVEDEIRLYRILDVTMRRTLGQMLFGVGTIHCCTADKTNPEFDIENVKNPRHVRELLSDSVEEMRDRKGVISREYMNEDVSDGHTDDEPVSDDDLPEGQDMHVEMNIPEE